MKFTLRKLILLSSKMKISDVSWRTRIGSFNVAHRLASSLNINGRHSILLSLICGITLGILLVMDGVEINPGPVSVSIGRQLRLHNILKLRSVHLTILWSQLLQKSLLNITEEVIKEHIRNVDPDLPKYVTSLNGFFAQVTHRLKVTNSLPNRLHLSTVWKVSTSICLLVYQIVEHVPLLLHRNCKKNLSKFRTCLCWNR